MIIKEEFAVLCTRIYMLLNLKNIVFKILIIGLSLLIINQTIDEVEFQPLFTLNQIGDFNDLNSAVEYVSEIILGHKDLFPEFKKEGSHKQSYSYKFSSVKMFEPIAYTYVAPQTRVAFSFSYPLDEKYSFLFAKEIIQPPCCNA